LGMDLMEKDEMRLIRGEWVRLPHRAVMGGEFFLEENTLTSEADSPTIENVKTRAHFGTAANQPQPNM
jgi:hypothetical protein